ncbi:hypothetical protein POM88_052395 [Heracleum sosnowskyi]|uniref:Uncharacterized protein n=1 Tax=Heracleum sosnowskyi TaxID=360622 RepID=A0AAD8GS96_9APIA|nr:hypothetical protein POM88_052395 [Heracleum sosnowskyi]
MGGSSGGKLYHGNPFATISTVSNQCSQRMESIVYRTLSLYLDLNYIEVLTEISQLISSTKLKSRKSMTRVIPLYKFGIQPFDNVNNLVGKMSSAWSRVMDNWKKKSNDA